MIASVARSDGGPTTGCLALHHALLDHAHSVVLATDADGPTGRLSATERAEIAAAYPQVAVYPRSRPLRLKASWAQAWAVLRTGRRCDVVHLHGLYLAHTVWAWLAAVIWRRPLVVQPHGVLEPYQRAFGVRHKRVWDTVVGRRIVRRAGLLVAASASEAAHLAALYPEVPRVVMPLGVADVQPTPPDAALAARLRPWLDAPAEERVVFLGRLAVKKQPDLLVRAWAAVGRGTLLVVGPEEDWTVADLEALAAEAGASRVVVAPAVDAATGAWLLEQAAIFVLPSLNENFAIAVGEAMVRGCAVVTTTETAAGEHVVAAGAGTVLREVDERSVAAAIDALLADPDAARRAGAAGAAYAREHLTWDAAARILLAAVGRAVP
ncbi:glycosyltransferase [Nocardioides sp. TRM66260-LWL]|uniref:glycosyltransferase n=1 Tax=Nocardioides sp. TRM66260-LWL TaxID=2874478 RepID=UPI001CC6AB97|nr:glycosyltransferase [Nocardioides sp. TRM66260-LWL]MBZ5734897.1 glycosyltransferase [Nocardioides sp. TRM66260-LWL]